MLVIERTIQVSFRHRVLFTQNVFAPDNPVLADLIADGRTEGARKVLFVVDEALANASPELVQQMEHYCKAHHSSVNLVAAPMIIEGGERAKNSSFHVTEIQSQVEKQSICRHSYVIAVGGGALLDVVGFAAATAHRGVRHIRIPTTTLSQDDSGVGVKNGINGFGKKNFIGTFAPPFAVINDFNLLASLPPRDKRAGYVEAVKVACIRDARFFESMERQACALRDFDPAAMQQIIHRSAELHVEHIAGSGDPFEFGSARPLDFGHWSAHKLEQLSDYRIRHGEAVAVGIALDTLYARNLGHLDADSAERILKLLENLGFDLFASELELKPSEGGYLVLKGLEEFREHLGGRLTITLLRAIGTGFEIHAMDPVEVARAIEQLRQRHQSRIR